MEFHCASRLFIIKKYKLDYKLKDEVKEMLERTIKTEVIYMVDFLLFMRNLRRIPCIAVLMKLEIVRQMQKDCGQHILRRLPEHCDSGRKD